jgi:hypothetical protein
VERERGGRERGRESLASANTAEQCPSLGVKGRRPWQNQEVPVLQAWTLMSLEGPCVKGLVPGWEVMEPLGGGAFGEVLRSLRGMLLKGIVGSQPFLSCSLPGHEVNGLLLASPSGTPTTDPKHWVCPILDWSVHNYDRLNKYFIRLICSNKLSNTKVTGQKEFSLMLWDRATFCFIQAFN